MKKSELLLFLGATCALFSSGLQADTYTATGAVTDWNDPALWGAPAMAGHDFVFAPTASFQRLTVTSGSFAGDSLTLAGGRFTIGSHAINQDLTFENYAVFYGGSNGVTHSGTWTVEDTGALLSRTPNMYINAVFVGSGSFWISDDVAGAKNITLSADSLAQFAGTLTVGTIGDDDVGYIQFTGDVNAPDVTLALDAVDNAGVMEYSQLDLNHTIAVGAVELAGVALDPGVYNFADLSAEQQLFFVDNGGQLVVSPPDAPTGTVIEVSSLESAPEWPSS